MKNDGIVPEDGKLDNKENENQNHEGASDKGGEKMIPKSRLDQEISKRKEADKAIEAVANELLEDIPEDFRDIVPDLPPAEKIKWIRNAQKKGLFNTNHKQDGPDSKRPGGKQPQDLSNLTPFELRRMGYKQ